jgi:hypothetical protein
MAPRRLGRAFGAFGDPHADQTFPPDPVEEDRSAILRQFPTEAFAELSGGGGAECRSSMQW